MSTEVRFDSDPWSSSATRQNWPVSAQIAVTAVATKLIGQSAGRGAISLQNLDASNNVFIGNETVTATTGFRLKPGEGVTLQNDREVYAICSAGQTATVGILEDVA